MILETAVYAPVIRLQSVDQLHEPTHGGRVGDRERHSRRLGLPRPIANRNPHGVSWKPGFRRSGRHCDIRDPVLQQGRPAITLLETQDDVQAGVLLRDKAAVMRLTLHIIGLEQQCVRGVKNGELVAGGSRSDFSELQMAAAMAAHYQAQHEALRPIVDQFDDEFLSRSVAFKTPAGEVFRQLPGTDFLFTVLLHHLIHHRGQLLTYLRLLGVKIPGLYGPTLENTPGAAH
jgi:uncharacterized damage-inducible protein DinB